MPGKLLGELFELVKGLKWALLSLNRRNHKLLPLLVLLPVQILSIGSETLMFLCFSFRLRQMILTLGCSVSGFGGGGRVLGGDGDGGLAVGILNRRFKSLLFHLLLSFWERCRGFLGRFYFRKVVIQYLMWVLPSQETPFFGRFIGVCVVGVSGHIFTKRRALFPRRTLLLHNCTPTFFCVFLGFCSRALFCLSLDFAEVFFGVQVRFWGDWRDRR